MNSTHWSTQASSSRCSATCARAITQARAVFQVASCNCITCRTTLKMIGMSVSSSKTSANRSMFSSPSPTASPSQSSSSLSLPSIVHMSTSSSTSSIHAMFTPTNASSKGRPSGFETSSSRPRTRPINASMALCRTSSSAKVAEAADATASKVSESSFKQLASLKNSGSASAAEIKASRVSLRSSSVEGVAKPCRVVTRAGITSATGAASSLARSSMNVNAT
mmetsp:Transcript_108214/g.271305  ORF Transcript_108214/g.271305 Transcript_108214/m.271305 type:complete len:222 (-) Transcript_108214:645-1310(-)